MCVVLGCALWWCVARVERVPRDSEPSPYFTIPPNTGIRCLLLKPLTSSKNALHTLNTIVGSSVCKGLA